MKVERQIGSGARLQMQSKINGKKLDEDREDGITQQWVVHFFRSKENEGSTIFLF